jgi:hypothetical protein
MKELETHLMISQRIGLAAGEVIKPLLTACESVGKLLRLLIRSLSNG